MEAVTLTLREILKLKGLTPRETDVTEYMVKGLSNEEIGARLFISIKSVKFHITSIFKRLRIKTRSQLIVLCLTGKLEEYGISLLPHEPPAELEAMPILSSEQFLPIGI
jgi:DNA-binding CsgD family transcriptional regulator